MITITIFAALLALIGTIIWRANEDLVDKVFYTLMFVLVGAFFSGLISYPIVRTFEGLMPSYSSGVREGYLTKLSTKGVVFKTNEAQLQIGTGNMAALQTPWAFSIPDPTLQTKAGELLGEKVRIRYDEWLVGPWRLGETSYIAIAIEPLETTPADR